MQDSPATKPPKLVTLSGLAAHMGVSRQAMWRTVNQDPNIPHLAYTEANGTVRRFFDLDVASKYLKERSSLPPQEVYSSDLLTFVRNSERWKAQKACHTAVRQFIAFAGTDPSTYTDTRLHEWENFLSERLRSGTVAVYVGYLDAVLRVYRASTQSQKSGGSPTRPPVTVTVRKRSKTEGPSTSPIDAVRIAVETCEALLDELFMTFRQEPFSWQSVSQAITHNPGLLAALEEAHLDPQGHQWPFHFNEKMKRLQGMNFESGLGLELLGPKGYGAFRSMQWQITRIPPKSPTWTPVPQTEIDQVRKGIKERFLTRARYMVSSAFSDGVISGATGDKLIQLAESQNDNFSLLRMIGKAYESQAVTGEQADRLHAYVQPALDMVIL